jgi:malate synthase
VFTAQLGDRPNQLDRLREDVSVTSSELLDVPSAGQQCTEAGLRNDVSVALQYIAAWLGGTGAVGINNLMEDAATAEISRTQVWQWINNRIVLDTGQVVDEELVGRVIDEEVARIGDAMGETGPAARDLFRDLIRQDTFIDFLTIPAYEVVARIESGR